MPKIIVALILYCQCFVNCAQLAAQAPTEASTVSNSIEEAIKDLGSRKYQQRRQAFLELWQAGDLALEPIQAAKTNQDVQISRSANLLELLLLLGISAENDDASLVQTLFKPATDTVTRLCQQKHWRLAEHLINTNPDLVVSFQRSSGRNYLNRIVEAALQQGQLERAWPIIRTITQNVQGRRFGASRDLSAFIADKLDLPLTETQLADTELTARRLLYSGDGQRAYDEGRSSEIRRLAISRGGLWKLLPKSLSLFGLSATGSVANKLSTATFLDFAGQIEEAQAIWLNVLHEHPQFTKLEDLTVQEKEDEVGFQILSSSRAPATDRLILAFLIAGRVEPVEKYLKNLTPDAAFRFYLVANDYGDAFEVIGLQRDLSNFEDWLAKEKMALRQEATSRITRKPKFGRDAQICGLLIGLGHADKAQQLMDVLATASQFRVTMWAGANSITSWLGRSEQRAFCLKNVNKHFEQMTADTKEAVLRELFPEFPFASKALHASAPLGMRNESGELFTAFDLLDKLHVWDTIFFDEFGRGREEITQWLRRANEYLQNERLKSRYAGDYPSQLGEMAKLAQGCGLPDVALSFASADSVEPSYPAIMHRLKLVRAKILLEQGKASEAAALYREVRTSDTAFNDQVSLVNEVKALMLAGRYEPALQLDRSRWLRPLGIERRYDGTSYALVTSYLEDESNYAQARDYAEIAFQLADFGNDDIYWAGGDLSQICVEQDDYQTSADALRSRLVESFTPASTIIATYTSSQYHNILRYEVQKERLHRAVALIDSGEYELADRNIAAAENLEPQDIELVVQCYPRLRDAGQTDRANRLFDSFRESMLEQIKEWPGDATALNNLAWMYSQCGRNLDEALELSKKAVELAPTSSVYLDTLAEVQFRLGNSNEAIRLMDECIRLDPRDGHYEKNIARYRAGLK